MVSTSKVTTEFKGVPQIGTHFCIPAGIENLMRSESNYEVTQELLVRRYLVAKDASYRRVPRFDLIKSFLDKPIPDASFQTFVPVAKKLLKESNSKIELTIIDGIKEPAEYVKQVEAVLALDKPVLIFANIGIGFHITLVYQSDGTSFWSYDPGEKAHVVKPISGYTFSHDILFVK
jgi:hypothetical protein